jgi:hypothetical protein
MKHPGDRPLPAAPPTWAEINERWPPRCYVTTKSTVRGPERLPSASSAETLSR